MVFDVLENIQQYQPLHKGFEKAIKFLLRPDLNKLPVDKYEIDGEYVYAMVSKKPGQKKEDGILETHEKYIDIQLVLEGTDDMGWKPKSSCKNPTGEYDENDDIQFFSDKPDAWITTKKGAFAIFFPEDAHMPLISSGQIHKVVVKIAVEKEK